MKKVEDLVAAILQFREDRDWKKFHNPKDLAISLVLEAGEVMEHFQWQNAAEMEKHLESHRTEIGEELADVLYWVLLMGHDFKIDVFDALDEKMKKNAAKYSVEKAKGSHAKYDKL